MQFKLLHICLVIVVEIYLYNTMATIIAMKKNNLILPYYIILGLHNVVILVSGQNKIIKFQYTVGLL